MILSIKPEKAGRMESAITSSFFLGALVSLVVITNPLTKIPLFLSLTEGWSSGAAPERSGSRRARRVFHHGGKSRRW